MQNRRNHARRKTFIKNVNLRKIQLVRITYKFKLKEIERTEKENEMKLWEAMKLLEEDPSMKFEYKDKRKKWLLYAEACYDDLLFYMLDCWDSKGELRTGDAFGSLHDNLTTSDNWQLVRED